MFEPIPAAEDRRLLMDIASGNQAALSELYNKVAPTLFGLITAVIADRTLAEEILQGVFLEAWQKARALNERAASISEWLWQRCRVQCLLALYQNKPDKKGALDEHQKYGNGESNL